MSTSRILRPVVATNGKYFESRYMFSRPSVHDDRIFVKCAWRLIPFMVLGLAPTVFGFGAGVFVAGYALFQGAVQRNARTGAKRWIFCIMAVWGCLSGRTRWCRDP